MGVTFFRWGFIPDAVTIATVGLESYVGDSTESLIIAARNVVRSITEEESPAAIKKQIREKKMEKLEKEGTAWAILERDKRFTRSGKMDMIERWKHQERN